MTDAQQVIDDIASGHHDGHLADLVSAARHRTAQTASPLRWRITLPDGETWTEDDLVVGEMATVERLTNKSWIQIEHPLASAGAFSAFVVAHLHFVKGMGLAAAITEAQTIRVADGVEMISEYQVAELSAAITPPPDG